MSFVAKKLQELDRCLDTFETRPRSFDQREFLKLHEELLSAYPAISGNEQECREADQQLVALLEHRKQNRSEPSILRRETIQIHATVFWLLAGGARNCHEAYTKANAVRTEKHDDVKYFYNEAFFRLIDEVEAIPPAVRLGLLLAIAQHVLEKPGVADPWSDATPYDDLTQIDKPRFFLHLVRRWQRYGRADLTSQGNRKENQLKSEEYLLRLGQQSPVVKGILEEMQYLRFPSLWTRLLHALRRIANRLADLFYGIPPGWARIGLYVVVGVLALALAVYTGTRIHSANSEMRGWLDEQYATTSGAERSDDGFRGDRQ